MRGSRRERPVLVTSAPKSPRDELAERQRRYLWTMGVRVVAFILAVTLLHGPWRFLGAVCAMVLPWVAVVVANAGPRRVRETPSLVQPRAVGPADRDAEGDTPADGGTHTGAETSRGADRPR